MFISVIANFISQRKKKFAEKIQTHAETAVCACRSLRMPQFAHAIGTLQVSYEEMEEEIVKWVSKKEGKSYHLAQVEATYFIVIAFDKDQECSCDKMTLECSS